MAAGLSVRFAVPLVDSLMARMTKPRIKLTERARNNFPFSLCRRRGRLIVAFRSAKG